MYQWSFIAQITSDVLLFKIQQNFSKLIRWIFQSSPLKMVIITIFDCIYTKLRESIYFLIVKERKKKGGG